MKNEKLSADEYDALEEVRRGVKADRVSACVGRNTKRLAGIKMFSVARNGQITITEKGQQALFLRRCILGLRAVSASADGDVKLDADVAGFLGKKAHIVAREGGYDITDKGRESLADIESQGF
ncbi:hypothetical protein [Pseudoduganella namucuonensis]|uniref:Uncharacterized protein n=1 Tax=Pseudoduganella namucuonensis TaxID=1035707 RepID=A0A1I7LX58_9BURK|nr:hypothetical protein [Pseudoduganella namucuonensis]SFV14180.1 hypothetical protein SAMN05216552_104140 [Pseudoduganella namucuonensis]